MMGTTVGGKKGGVKEGPGGKTPGLPNMRGDKKSEGSRLPLKKKKNKGISTIGK